MPDSEPNTYLLDRVGQVLAGRYRIVTLLNAGGMGSIWIAEHTALKRKVVAKFHEKGFIGARAKTALQRFLREAKTLSTVRHRNVTELYESGMNDEGEPYLIMEYLEGETLHHRTKREGVLPYGVALRIAAAIADGLAVAHQADVLHRDVKPDNIILKREPEGEPTPKLLDFGLARPVVDASPLTAEGRMVGTPGYVSPEQARGRRDLDQRVDVYALGVTLYEMLTRRLPSLGETGMDHLIYAATEEPVPLIEYRPDLVGPTSDVIMTSIARDRDERYPDALAFRDALLDLLERTSDPSETDTDPRGTSGSLEYPDTFFSQPPIPLGDDDLEPVD